MAVLRGFDAATTLPLRFAPDQESDFQARHYANVRATLRLSSLLLAVLALLYAGRDLLDTGSLAFVLRSVGSALAFYLLVFGLTFVPRFARVWQPILVIGGWLATAGTLGALVSFLGAPPPSARPVPPLPVSIDDSMFFSIFFTLQACVLMVSMATFRLTFPWALALQVGIVAIGAFEIAFRMPGDIAQHETRFLQSALLVLFTVLLAAYVQDGLARRAFLAHLLLDRERDDERRRREQTEQTLQILGHAIGGIAHDLGNPLTTVQLGASTLLDLAGRGEADPDLIEAFARHVTDGAQMLSYLRLSLIEQTRVLEGKPTPVDRSFVPLRRIVEAGIHYQKPVLAFGRTITFDGEDFEIFADEMKLVTVLMNLIDNALKYSDGSVRVIWRADAGAIYLGVLDQGRAGAGLARAQARRLFAPFGRLDQHREIDGTGLGLLSVRKIAEAHGGEAFIEGRDDGTHESPAFTLSKAPKAPLSLLTGAFRTAFVLVFPRPDIQTENCE